MGRIHRPLRPPAYVDVLYAADPRAHIQAIGRDAVGRLQYRYHPDWQRVRELRKARRLARLAEVLPQIRPSIARYLGAGEPTRAFTLAAVIDLVARSAIRPGSKLCAVARHARRGDAAQIECVGLRRDRSSARAQGAGTRNRRARPRETACL
jgi:DNA topoisomerase-1